MGVSRIARGIFDPPIVLATSTLAYLPLIVICSASRRRRRSSSSTSLLPRRAAWPRAGVKSVMIEQINAAYSMGHRSGR
jgi:taurine transport system permease protein